jgi:N-acetylmuramoyl-L-alanine amidase
MDRIFAPVALAALLAACTPGAPATGPSPDPTPGRPAAPRALEYQPISPALPPIPEANGALDIRVIHPTRTQDRPNVDSTFIYGSVGRGGVALEINGAPVPVARNGAFIAYLPTPRDGTWRLRAAAGGQEDTEQVSYRPEADFTGTGAGGTPSRDAVFSAPRLGTVTGGADTLATGSDAIYARPTRTGTYRWFFPRGARLSVLERRGSQYRVQLDAATEAWVDAENIGMADTTATPPDATPIQAARIVRSGQNLDVRVAARGRPFLVETSETGATITVYGASSAQARSEAPADAWYRGATTTAAGASTQYALQLASAPWGYKAWYEGDGTLVVRVRRPPAIDPANPLRGRRIVIDPGHPPAGATGPTGLYEGDANLAIALPLAEKLRAAGAEVIMTRTNREGMVSSTQSGPELRARVALAVQRDAEMLISVHNNAFGEGANPFRAHGTSVYYFHPFSAALARALDREIVGVTRIPDIGARVSNLALARPTWMPTALTESLFMPIPEQEAALRNPEFVERLADAHLRGIEAFLRERAGGAR